MDKISGSVYQKLARIFLKQAQEYFRKGDLDSCRRATEHCREAQRKAEVDFICQEAQLNVERANFDRRKK